MEIINHPLCTNSIGAPSDMAEPACSPLPVALHTDEHGTWSVSFWRPSDEDMETLMAGGGVALHVRASGRQHPVVGLGVWPALDLIEDSGIGNTSTHVQAALDTKVRDQAAELRAEEAIRADLVALVHKAQAILGAYLDPEGPSKGDTIEALIFLLEGQSSKSALTAAGAA